MQVLAVIPARAGSKRLPGKNTRSLFGKPLIAWTIDFARTVPWFSEVHVSTDGADIAAVAERHGVAVPRLRPAELASDESGSVDVIVELLSWYRGAGQSFDAVALLQPTTPVRLPGRWEKARELLAGDCDGVIGVCAAATHPYLALQASPDGYVRHWMPDAAGVTRAQDYPPAYAINGSLYLVRTDALLAQRSFCPARCRFVVCSEPVENVDIDTPFDWRMAEAIVGDWTERS